MVSFLPRKNEVTAIQTLPTVIVTLTPLLCSAKRQTYSRAYINFNDSKAVVDFKSKFDGFVFVGARGTQYRCAIEFAPYQRLPKQKSKTDHREGTIETGDASHLIIWSRNRACWMQILILSSFWRIWTKSQ